MIFALLIQLVRRDEVSLSSHKPLLNTKSLNYKEKGTEDYWEEKNNTDAVCTPRFQIVRAAFGSNECLNLHSGSSRVAESQPSPGICPGFELNFLLYLISLV